MLRNKKIMRIGLVILVLGVVTFIFVKNRRNTNGFVIEELKPKIGSIHTTVSTTGVVEPQNRLEIKPPINGRVEEILVQEGDTVKKGKVLALMSSTERAALLDAARAQGEEAIKYWEDVYKATPLISPINGKVIVRAVEPGQTVTSQSPVIVLSDQLIVKAQFDETDIGKIRKGQRAIISLDAYPETEINGIVGHIAYESKIVNNVTIYEVDILPGDIPEFFRSGMSANVDVIEKEKNDILVLPSDAVISRGRKNFVRVKGIGDNGDIEKEVEIGLSNGTNIEITAGLSHDDIVLVQREEYSLSKKRSGGSPFMPGRRR